MLRLFNFFKKKKQPKNEPIIHVIAGKECPICGEYGLFSYHTKEKGKYYFCEDCFREISNAQFEKLKKEKK